jgi:hypothetical protein
MKQPTAQQLEQIQQIRDNRQRYTVTLTLTADSPISVDLLRMALETPPVAMRTRHRVSYCLEKAVGEDRGIENVARLAVQTIQVEGGDNGRQ